MRRPLIWAAGSVGSSLNSPRLFSCNERRHVFAAESGEAGAGRVDPNTLLGFLFAPW